jgi:murein peptide amidase A
MSQPAMTMTGATAIRKHEARSATQVDAKLPSKTELKPETKPKPEPPNQIAADINVTHVKTAVEQCQTLRAKFASGTAPICDAVKGDIVMGNSQRGETVYGFKVGASEEKANIRVLVIGAIHGDETSAGWLPFQWIADDLHGKASRERVAVLVMPVTNPDHALSPVIKRTNARDVDLNRNFPTENWEKESVKWWTQTTKRDPRRFPGKKAASEAETKLIIETIDKYKPHAIMSVHAPYNVLDFDGRNVPPPERIGSLRLDTVGIYPGSLGNYAAMVRGIPVITLELPAAQRPTSLAEARKMWGDFAQWLRTNAKLMKQVVAEANVTKLSPTSTVMQEKKKEQKQ